MKEILLGYYSDPPGVSMYTKKMEKGQVKLNKYGMEEIECCRGTNRVEAFHKNLNDTFGSWHVGVAMTHVFLAERRHRHNHRTSERRRADFPNLGYFDTWLTDSLQTLVLKNHNMVLYPNWVNTSDFKDTPESFDTVPLHSQQLDRAVRNKCDKLLTSMQSKFDQAFDRSRQTNKKRKTAKFKLTADQQYLCTAFGTNLPFLPFTTTEEMRLFNNFAANLQTKNDHEMALSWCHHVDGVKIFPKLPVHIRTYHKKWQKNRRIKDCMEKAKGGVDLLDQLNKALQPCSTRPTALLPVLKPSAIDPPTLQAQHNESYSMVGGIMIGDAGNMETCVPARRSRGSDRGSTKRKRKCTICEQNGGMHMYECGGQGGGKKRCDYFDQQGKRRYYR